MTYTYKAKGVCAVGIEVEMDGNIVKSVKFIGGCNGNTQGVARLVEGLTYEEVKEKLSGIRCGFKATSCPDQLVHAIEEAMANA
ncbi:MAG: TIGR03905 family TSCPD domain-containing protein [Clostridia bacterium]|nr:TIGR03905 family TSCPD domain-containing protein [Clostridia bacterium]